LKDDKPKPVTVELASAAQKVYRAQEGKDKQSAQGKPSQLDLKPGWGGQGK